MGLSIADRIDRLFAHESNFDESGFINPDLVSADLAERLANLTQDERKELLRRGYGLHWFDDWATDGMIVKLVEDKDRRGKRLGYTLKLYYNQKYPKEIERSKEKNGE